MRLTVHQGPRVQAPWRICNRFSLGEKSSGIQKILISPHLGASTTESEENCARMAVRELKGYLEYGNITHSVNFPNVESTPTVNVHTRLIMINRDEPGMIGAVSNILGRHRSTS